MSNSLLSQSLRFLGFGTLFGFILSRVGATDFDAILGMFRLTDLHLMGVIGFAVLTAGIGLRVIRAKNPDRAIAPKPQKKGMLAGAALFGVGWALTGTCPGTGLAQIGEGKLLALFTIVGILAGAALYRFVVTPRVTKPAGGTELLSTAK